MNTCLYCEREADSLEHVVPAAFGEFKNAPNLLNRVCKTCNNQLGLLDEQYSRCGPEAFFRKHYGIQGRSTHDKVNVFERGSAGGQRIALFGTDPNLGVDVAFESENGAWRQMRHLVFSEKTGKTHHLPIREGSTAEQLRTAYEKLGVAKPFDVHAFYAPEEKDWVERLIKETWPSEMVTGGPATSTVYKEIVGTLGLTNRYFRAIAKFGFHYFLTQFPQLSGREVLFSDIRQFIVDDTEGVDRANHFIGVRQHPLLVPMLNPDARPDGWRAHVLCVEAIPGEYLAHIQVFVSEDWPAPAYTILLARDPRITETHAAGHFYMYFKDGQSSQFAGEALNLEVMRADFPAPPVKPVVRLA